MVQACSPLAGGRLVGEVAKMARALGDARGVSSEAIQIAWLLRHPAGIHPILGTTTPTRLVDSCRAADSELSREQWYGLLQAV